MLDYMNTFMNDSQVQGNCLPFVIRHKQYFYVLGIRDFGHLVSFVHIANPVQIKANR